MLRGLIGLVILVALVSFGSSALGHEQRQVGPYTIEVGWRDEPALAGLLNAVEVEVRETATGHRVEGLAKTLKLTITFGGTRTPFEPELRSLGTSDPGHYVADMIPTATGDYLFRLRGKIGSQEIDEVFESGPGRFDSVRAASSIAFPAQDALDPAVARELRSLRDTADQTRALALGGAALAALACVLSVVALRASRLILARRISAR